MKLLPVALLFLVFPWSIAHAYVDPGSGYVIIQLVMAAGIGLLFYVKRIVAAIQALFVRSAVTQPTERNSEVNHADHQNGELRKAG